MSEEKIVTLASVSKQKKQEPLNNDLFSYDDLFIFLRVLDTIRHQSPSHMGYVNFTPEMINVSLERPLKETTFGKEEFATLYLSHTQEAAIWFNDDLHSTTLNLMEAFQKMQTQITEE